MHNNIFTLFLFIYIITSLVTSDKNSAKSAKLPVCKACTVFVESFTKGIEKTKNGKFEGGDTAWEEQKLRSYATSEIRLVEIQEKVCSDVTYGQDQCYTLNEHYDSQLEDWWFHKQTEEPDLFKYLCIDTLKHCCPAHHYGPACSPCEGFPGPVCSSNGACKGAGTRKGNGRCVCQPGYAGPRCATCADTYHEEYSDAAKPNCVKCHVACHGTCTKAGPDGCLKCADGWLMNEEKTCTDINECAESKSPCIRNQFCVNNDGSFTCLDCDRSCTGCTGDGPDMCVECASNFVLIDKMCIDADQESRNQHVFITRYLTYLGLCIATCIIFNKSTIIASAIGIAVAVYISVSEYVLNTPITPPTGPQK